MASPLKILILEDMPEDVGLVERVLKRDGLEFVTKQVDTREEFIVAMESFMPDIILSDHALPQFNSIEALKISKAKGRKIPFILVTGTVSEEFAVNCLKQGADDYVLKSNLSRLPSAIRMSIRHHDMQDEKEKADVDVRMQNSELIKINKELDTFVYNISHNLRSPLASALGLIQLAKKEDFSVTSLTNYLSMMENSITKLDHTLKEILDYSQNNRNEINITQVDLHKLTQECYERLSYMDGQKDIAITINIEGRGSFFSDNYRLSVLLSNLLSNSLKYRDKSKGKPVITLWADIAEPLTTIRIEDNGIGIEDRYIPKIFDMFYRASEQGDGAGLGLYIAKEIIHVLNGTISVSSQPNQGTTVSMTVPNIKRRQQMPTM